MRLYKNGTHISTLCANVCVDTVAASINFSIWGCILVKILKDDYIEMKVWHNQANTLATPAGSDDKNWICVEEV